MCMNRQLRLTDGKWWGRGIKRGFVQKTGERVENCRQDEAIESWVNMEAGSHKGGGGS